MSAEAVGPTTPEHSPDATRVLLVEDDVSWARLIERRLRWARGVTYHVVHAPDIDAGLGELEHAEFDVVLLDLRLPDSDPPATLASVSALSTHVPVVVLTGEDDDVLVDRAVRAGAQDYLLKERQDTRSLARSLRYALARYQRERRRSDIARAGSRRARA